MDLAGATSDLQPWLSVYQREKCRELLLVGITMILFSTFSEQALQLYKQLLPADAGSTFHWISKTMKIQYSSNIILLRWVFVQAVSAWLAVTMLLLEWRNVRR